MLNAFVLQFSIPQVLVAPLVLMPTSGEESVPRSKDLQTSSVTLFHGLPRDCVPLLVDPNGLSALLACRLVALDKNPGVRPIGICETVRRIIAKAASNSLDRMSKRLLAPSSFVLFNRLG